MFSAAQVISVFERRVVGNWIGFSTLRQTGRHVKETERRKWDKEPVKRVWKEKVNHSKWRAESSFLNGPVTFFTTVLAVVRGKMKHVTMVSRVAPHTSLDSSPNQLGVAVGEVWKPVFPGKSIKRLLVSWAADKLAVASSSTTLTPGFARLLWHPNY